MLTGSPVATGGDMPLKAVATSHKSAVPESGNRSPHKNGDRLEVLQATPTEPAVGIDGVSIVFGLRGGGAYTAVETADLAVRPGEFVSIVGPTGCGKSTLLNVAAGLLRPSAGQVKIFGERLKGLNSRAGYLFQQDALMPWKTALDNVAVSLEPKGVSRTDALESAREWLRRVGLSTFMESYPHMMSGGQRKRVALAQMLIRDPEIFLMDEPFGPLDAQTRQIMGNLLLNLWAANRKAVLFITHDLEEAIALSDRVVVMSAGPAARIIGEFPVTLARPRDISEIRLDPAFHHIHKEIWSSLRVEVQKAYSQGEGIPA
jgi:NitT/TauT family transport system ATP-binding protein